MTFQSAADQGADANQTSPKADARAHVRGKPRDVDPALSRVLPAFNLAVEFAETGPGASPRRIHLVGLHGETAMVTILHAPSDGSLRFLRTDVEMAIEARVGHLGNTQKAEALAQALAERLKELAEQE